ncbi:hypothetical protein COV93_05485 [Candidatus Woesearchaeota archaeon CG11_big_fil_rev_8_21_14_0_20_43_8]|nr:MAG: hypothetical protein COV93_05485 [Candidatus Woesearchaeota archaeon CG11_big_fil_rev_8_21_14_0_20_43_8]
MEIRFDKKPKKKGVTIIEGFPGFGLVGSITTEFLIEHLKTEKIGQVFISDVAPIAAIHDEKLIEPMAIHYNEKYNIVIIHVITNVTGFEWKMTEAIRKIEHELTAKEIISIEGVSGRQNQENVFFFTKNNDIRKKKLEKCKIYPLKEGIIMGVTAGLLLKVDKVPLTCLFAETHSNIPDSKAAAGVIKALDRYLGLEVDYEPLIKSAERFEASIKDLMTKSQEAENQNNQKKLNYVG